LEVTRQLVVSNWRNCGKLPLRGCSCRLYAVGRRPSVTAAFFHQLAKMPRLPAGLVAAGLLWLCGTNVAAEMAPPEGGSLDFAIVRKGEVIGGYKADFNRLADGRLEVTLLVKADVSLGPISLYHFHQVTREVWRGEQLVAMTSDTEEDSEKHHLTVAEDNGDLAMTVDGKTERIAADSVPMSLWSAEMVTHSRPIFDSNDGQLYKTETTCEAAAPHAGEGIGQTCQITGELQRSLRYDASGLLDDVSFSADDGTHIHYKRR